MLRMAHRILDAKVVIPDTVPADAHELTYLAAKSSQDMVRSPSMEIVIADNVAEFYFASEQMEWSDEDFPHVAPPFPMFCIEHACPAVFRNVDRLTGEVREITGEQNPILQTAYVFMSIPADTARQLCQSTPSNSFVNVSWGPILEESEPKWIVQCVQWMALKKNGAAFPTGLLWSVGVSETGKGLSRTCWPGIFAGHYGGDPAQLNAEMHLPWLVLSFMHCKNVRRIECTEAAGPEDKWLRRKKLPRLVYHQLDIGPMREVLTTEGQMESVGLKRALHICRGHFATYSDERPLFGKYTGQFWKPSHVRGAAEFGIVQKDYNVHPNR